MLLTGNPNFVGGDRTARALAVKAGQDSARAGSYLGQVGTHCYVHNSTLETHKQSMCRASMFARAPIVRPRVAFGNFYVEGSAHTEAAPAAPATVIASVEYPAGVFTRVTFSGASAGTISSGGTILSDDVPLSIPMGALFWVRSWINCDAGVTYTGGGYLKDNATLGDGYTSGSTTPDLTMGGAVTSDNGFWAPPLAIIARTCKPSFLFCGDSRTLGNSANIGSSGVGGMLKAIGLNFAHINVGRSGDWAARAAVQARNRFALGAYVSDIVWAYGVNDVTNGVSGAQVLASTVEGGTQLRRMYPHHRLWVCTLPPVTNAANTATNSSNSRRIEYNNLVRQGPSPFDGVLDLADALESARDSGFWAPGPGDASLTSDDIHLTLAGNDRVTSSGLVPPEMFLPR